MRALQKRNSRRASCEGLEPRRLLTGTWTALAHAAPTSIGTMMLLSDGTVMAHDFAGAATWYRLTPDSSGSYVNGTWTSRAPMSLARLYFASNVLKDGRVLVVGGEYSGPSLTQNFTNTGEIYDPVANSWSSIPNFPQTQFGDDPSEMLPDGRVLMGYISGPQTYIYDPVSNTWSAGPTKLAGDRSDEETWVKLSDDSILSYNIFGNPQHAQRYVPQSNSWVDAGTVPVQLHTTAGSELGPALRLPDGRVMIIGATNHNAIYTPPAPGSGGTGSWVAAPDTPGGIGANDAPGAMMPNGHILYAAGNTSNFVPPTTLFEYDPVANSITQVTGGPNLTNVRFDLTRMLMLPSGQVLFGTASNQLWVYTPDGSPDPSWRPAITNIVGSGVDNVFTLTGTQINGISEGASYGDDAEMSSNYPIVRLTNDAGVVAFAHSFNWRSTGVATGSTPVTCQFALPSGFFVGTYHIVVIANGIASPDGGYTLVNIGSPPIGIWTGLGDGITWHQAANWSQSTIPFPSSDVTINLPAEDPTIIVSQSESIHSIVTNEALNISGSLNIAAASQFNADVTLSGNLSDNGDCTFSSTLNWQGGTMTGNGTTIIAPSATLTMGGPGVRTSGRALEVDGQASLAPGADKVLVVPALLMGVGAVFDLNDNSLVIDYDPGGPSPAQQIEGYLGTGYAAGAWNGPGIDSSIAHITQKRGLDLAEAADLSGPLPSAFTGITIDGSAVLVAYGLPADANLDQSVDIKDFSVLAANLNASGKLFSQGDFNFDGLVNSTDLGILARIWNDLPPMIDSLGISPSAPITTQTLTANVIGHDVNGDPITYRYQWTKNGNPIAGETGSILDLSQVGNGDRDDAIAVTVTPYDGFIHGKSLTSTAVTVANSVPVIDSVSVIPPSVTTNSILTAIVNSHDADNDPVNLLYQWTRNGIVIPGQAGSVLDLSLPGNGDRGDVITVTVTPDDGVDQGTPVTPAAVTIQNTTPVASAGGPYSVPEGGSILLNGSASSDPDLDPIAKYEWDFNFNGSTFNVSSTTTSSTLTFSAVGLDGPSSRTVALRVTDPQGAVSNPSTVTLQITNVQPTIALSGDSNAFEGSPYTLHLGAITDPGQDTVTQYRVLWGDGLSTTYTAAQVAAASGDVTHTYPDADMGNPGTAPSTVAIRVDLKDEDTGAGFRIGAGTKSIQVQDVAPSVTITGASTGTVGSPITLGADVVDPSPFDAFPTWAWNVYKNGNSTPFASDSTNGSFTFTPDEAGTYEVHLDVTDDDGATGTAAAFTITVPGAFDPQTVTASSSDLNPAPPRRTAVRVVHLIDSTQT